MNTDVRFDVTRTRIAGAILAVMGVVILVIFGFDVPSAAHATLDFQNTVDLSDATWSVGSPTFDIQIWNIVLGAILLVTSGWILWRTPRRTMTVLGVGAIVFLFSFLLWTTHYAVLSPATFNPSVLLWNSVPWIVTLIFGSLSGVMCERSGVVNIAIEGQLMGGVIIATIVASATQNWAYAAVAGAAIGALLGLLLAWLALRWRSDQIVIGVAIAIMVTPGLDNYIQTQILTPYQSLNSLNPASRYAIPLLSKIPIVGTILFDENAFFYLAVILIFVVSFALFRTKYGLRVRAVGEYPRAAASSGINVIRVRYINVVLGGAIAGLGGVALLSSSASFIPDLTSGAGYIALAAVIFGRWRPAGAVTAAIIFGITKALAGTIQSGYTPPINGYLMDAVPYLLMIAVVAGLVGRVRPPASDGIPYAPESA